MFIKQIALYAGHLDSMQALLRRAVREESLPLAQYAIQHGAQVNRRDTKDAKQDYHIVRAAYSRANAIARELIGAGANVNVSCEHGHTPLIVASARGNIPLVHMLLKAKADVHLTDCDGITALMEAAGYRSVEIVDALLRAGAKCEASDKDGRTALHFALQALKVYHLFFLSSKTLFLIDRLCTASSVNMADKKGITPLMIAASTGLTSIVPLLLKNGANRHMMDDSGKTALDLAYEKRKKTEELLHNIGQIIPVVENAQGFPQVAKRTDRLYNRLDTAVYFNELEKVKRCLAEGDDVNTVALGFSLLATAVRQGHVEMVKLLLQHGANPQLEHNGYTALSDAIDVRFRTRERLAEENQMIASLET